jgi:hypothetical protein
MQKHGSERRRQWRKLHIGIDAQTLQIRAICVTSNDVSDAAVVAEMLEQVLQQKLYSALTGGGAYDTQPVYEAAIQRGQSPSFLREERTNTQRRCLCDGNAALCCMQTLAEGYGKCGVAATGAVWLRR